MRFKYPKENRLLSKKDFKAVFKAKNRFECKHFILNYAFFDKSIQKLGITIPKSYGCAAKRNYFKRITRELFRLNRGQLPSNIHLNISPKKSLISFATLAESFSNFTKSI